MTLYLSRNLFSVVLSYVLDDAELIEQLLSEYVVDVEYTLPVALRNILLHHCGVDDMPFFSTATLSQYLTVLWDQGLSPQEKLRLATKQDLTYLVPYFLRGDMRVHLRDTLYQAIALGHTSMVKLLIVLDTTSGLEYKDFDAKYNSGLTTAACNGHTDIVQVLLDHNANIHTSDEYCLRMAAAAGHTNTVELLLQRKADIHYWDDDALALAARGGHIATVKLLLEYDANVHAKNDYALVCTMQEGHVEIINLLLERNCAPM